LYVLSICSNSFIICSQLQINFIIRFVVWEFGHRLDT
jgi:hypothetical protein